MPTRPQGMKAGFGLALLAHVLLLGALAYGVNWRNPEPQAVSAELWSAVPQPEVRSPSVADAPPVSTSTRQRVPPPSALKPALAAPAPVALPDPQIAINQAKQEKLQRDKLKRESLERTQLDLLQKKQEQQRIDAAKVQREEAQKKLQAERAETNKLAAAREANLQRMLSQAGGAASPGAATPKASSGPSASYAGRVMQRIKPNLVFAGQIEGNPSATVEVRLAPDGTITAKRLVKSSGVKAWDEAVLRAIERTEQLPRDTDGSVPPPFEIVFKPNDL
jgi:colicin import membrane protein